MICEECSSKENYFDERLGERVCSECGLVLVQELFEETVHILDGQGELKHSSDKGNLGSVITGKGSSKYNRRNYSATPPHIRTALIYCNMVLSNVSSSLEAKERIEEVYLELYASLDSFKKYTYENRATAIVYYVLKEQGNPASLKEVCKEFQVESKLVKKILRKINSFYKNKVNYTPVNPEFYLRRTLIKITNDLSFYNQSIEVLTRFEQILLNANYTKSRSYYASICWITSNVFVREYTRSLIAEKAEIDEKCIYLQTKSLLSLLGLNNVKQLRGKDVNKIGE